MLRVAARVLAVVAGLLALTGAALQITGVSGQLSREGAGLTEVQLEEGNLAVAWEPRAPYRPAWAGQVNRYGFRYNVYSDGSGYAWAPLWDVTTGCGVVSCTFAFLGWRWRRKPGKARCATCGYDLRASPERCPECGTTVTPPARG